MPFLLRLVVTFGALLACLFLMASAGRAGLSRLLTEEALAYNKVEAANEAALLEPLDPEAYYARGVLLSASGNFDDAIENFMQSLHLRPQDKSAWLQLGKTYQEKGNLTMATEALSEAVRLAPYYAEPRWYLGNCLLNRGNSYEAFRQLRIAAESDPSLLPGVIDLAWRVHGGVPEKVLQAVDPQTDPGRAMLASFFITKNQMKEAVNLLRSASRAANYDRYRFMVQLIEGHRYRDAANVLNTGAGSVHDGIINDGDFERSKLSTAIGFDWQVMREPGTTRIAVDNENAHSGSRSLSVIFNGFTGEEAEFVKQLVLVEPRTRYRLTFACRSQDLESEGLPRVSVVEAGATGRLLAESNPATSGTTAWSTYKVDFETGGLAQAAYLIVQRQRCPNEVCPIFGRVWFDNFSLTKL